MFGGTRPALLPLLLVVVPLAVATAGDDRPAIDHQAILKERINVLLPQILREQSVDMWLVFTREGAKDPILPTIGIKDLVARAAFVFSLKNGHYRKIAIAATFDVSPIEATGLYDEVVSYGSEGVKANLTELLEELDPQLIASHVSRDAILADGLTVGMRNYFEETLGETHGRRLIPSERLVVSLLSKKLLMEIRALRTAVLATKQIISETLTPDRIEIGYTTEAHLGQFMRRRTEEMQLEVALLSIVVGPTRGHSAPTDRTIQPGDLIRIHFGVRYEGYAADIQRTAYVLRARESEPPAEIVHLWQVALASSRASVAAIKPGATGIKVDEASRKVILDHGFEGYPHAAGHAIGLRAHDIRPTLGPDWPERYGNTVLLSLEVNQVYAVQPTLYTEDPFTGESIDITLGENVIVTKGGAEHIGEPQRELIVVDCGC